MLLFRNWYLSLVLSFGTSGWRHWESLRISETRHLSQSAAISAKLLTLEVNPHLCALRNIALISLISEQSKFPEKACNAYRTRESISAQKTWSREDLLRDIDFNWGSKIVARFEKGHDWCMGTKKDFHWRWPPIVWYYQSSQYHPS